MAGESFHKLVLFISSGWERAVPSRKKLTKLWVCCAKSSSFCQKYFSFTKHSKSSRLHQTYYASFHEILQSVRCNAVLAIGGVIRGTFSEKLDQELGLELLKYTNASTQDCFGLKLLKYTNASTQDYVTFIRRAIPLR